MWKSICFFIIPVGLGIINTQRVEVWSTVCLRETKLTYGQVFATLEFFGGIIKLLLVAAVVLILICLNLGGLSPQVNDSRCTCANKVLSWRSEAYTFQM
jgi:amino acid permease